MRRWWLWVAFVLPLGIAAEAAACGTCAVGDPTLTIVGFEQPAAHRVRTSLTMRHRQDRIGDPEVDEMLLSEQRLEIAAAYSPTDRWVISVMMPVVHRLVTEVNLAESDIWAPGDLDLRARAVVYRDRKFAPRHLLAVTGGLELPTSSVETDANGDELPLEFQAGSRSWDPIAGVSYIFFSNPWSVFVSSTAIFPTEGTAESTAGISFRQSANAQYQPLDFLGFRLGAEFRVDQPTMVAGERDPNSGGHITYANLGVIALPHPKVLLHITASIPVVQRLDGFHEESLAVAGGLVYDI